MKLTEEEREQFRELFRTIGAAGGTATAQNMTPEARKKRAQIAAAKRWKKTTLEKVLNGNEHR